MFSDTCMSEKIVHEKLMFNKMVIGKHSFEMLPVHLIKTIL